MIHPYKVLWKRERERERRATAERQADLRTDHEYQPTETETNRQRDREVVIRTIGALKHLKFASGLFNQWFRLSISCFLFDPFANLRLARAGTCTSLSFLDACALSNAHRYLKSLMTLYEAQQQNWDTQGGSANEELWSELSNQLSGSLSISYCFQSRRESSFWVGLEVVLNHSYGQRWNLWVAVKAWCWPEKSAHTPLRQGRSVCEYLQGNLCVATLYSSVFVCKVFPLHGDRKYGFVNLGAQIVTTAPFKMWKRSAAIHRQTILHKRWSCSRGGISSCSHITNNLGAVQK